MLRFKFFLEDLEISTNKKDRKPGKIDNTQSGNVDLKHKNAFSQRKRSQDNLR